MKVLEEGGTAWPKELRCSECGALLLVEKEDLFQRTDTGSLVLEHQVFFECPRCEQHTLVDFVPRREAFMLPTYEQLRNSQ